MAVSRADLFQAIRKQLCAGGLLHPKVMPPELEQPCALCSLVADLLDGDTSIPMRLTLIERNTARG